ncbi:MAG: reverse gyrase [Desulfurococcaceae archaeon]
MGLPEHAFGIYRNACPNCGGAIDDLHLRYGAPCSRCLRNERVLHEAKKFAGDRRELLEFYYRNLKKDKKGGRLRELLEEEERVEEFVEFFREATNGLIPSSAQKLWARRALRGESFSIIAPTGMGKTLFSLVLALFFLRKLKEDGRKSLLVFPTTALLLQASERLASMAARPPGVPKPCSQEEWGEGCLRIIAMHGRLTKKLREFYAKALEEGNFDVLMCTSAFMHRHAELLSKWRYGLVVMDDVDSVLRSAKAVRALMKVLGVGEQQVEEALKLLRARKAGELPEDLRKFAEEVRRRVTLIINSATGRPRGLYPQLFRVFFNFTVGTRPESLRNVVDAYVDMEGDGVAQVVDLVKRLGPGGLVFVTPDRGVGEAKRIADALRENGVRAEAVHARKLYKRIIDAFSSGELDVLVGVATYYGSLVRGLDLPHRVRYVIFVGVPRHKFSLKLERVQAFDLVRLLSILSLLKDALAREELEELNRLAARLSNRLRRLGPGALRRVQEEFDEMLAGEQVEETPLLRDLRRAHELVRKLLGRGEVVEALKRVGDVAVVREGNEYYLMIPDAATYVQASGRCSRLYPGGLTRGLSIVIADDARLLNGLARRMRWAYETFEFAELEKVNLAELLREIDSDRERVRNILEGKEPPKEVGELVRTALLIVESPNKARTIANFFGRPSARILDGVKVYDVASGNLVLTIVASGGHVVDVVTDYEREGDDGVNVYGVLRLGSPKSPLYLPVFTFIKKCADGRQVAADGEGICEEGRGAGGVVQDKGKVIEALRRLARDVDVVLIGTDPDTEGEKIGWDLMVLLRPYAREVQRIEFHEVTRRAIMEALRKPRDFDEKLVEAQLVRRIEDRWLGFVLSEYVQKYAWHRYCVESPKRGGKALDCCIPNKAWSAGRVQTPVLRMIVERHEEANRIENAKYAIRARMEDGDEILIVLDYDDLGKLPQAKDFLGSKEELAKLTRHLKKAKPVVKVVGAAVEERVLAPPPPYTTDALLEDANRLLGLTATRTMELAQNLFELGLITYHRTDSTRISEVGMAIARQYLEERYGEKYKEVFEPKAWGEGGAHEGIRPTRPIDADRLRTLVREGVLEFATPLRDEHYRLYDLIFRRFIASQMAKARARVQRLFVSVEGSVSKEVERIVDAESPSFLDFYVPIGLRRAREVKVPQEGLVLEVVDVWRLRRGLLKVHEVIRWMKENGIGRPSTYAKMVQVNIDRGYVWHGRRGTLKPTRKGKVVCEFLSSHFDKYVSVERTRRLEEKMRMVEEGKADYLALLGELERELEELRGKGSELEKGWLEACGNLRA